MFLRFFLLFTSFVFSCATLQESPPLGNYDSDKESYVNGLRPLDGNGDLFTDRFNILSSLYENSVASFRIQFPKKWRALTYTRSFPVGIKKQALLLRNTDRNAGINGEMVLLALHEGRRLQLRIIIEEVNLDPERYYEIIRKANQKDLRASKNDFSKLVNIVGKEMIMWEYSLTIKGVPIRFIEYQLRNKRFNFRFTFWTLESLMDSSKKEVNKVMTSLSFI